MKKEVNTLHCILKQVMITNINANGLTGKLRKNINLKAKLNYQITSGSKTITENGTYDIARYNEVVVDTIVPSGDIEITTNGTYDVAEYENAIVDCPSDLDWSALGYSDRPPTIDEGYEYALEIKNNWNTSGTIYNGYRDLKILFFPTVDLSNYTSFTLQFAPHVIYIGSLNTSRVGSFYNVFNNCYALKKIEALDTSNSNNTRYMFGNCYSLTDVPKLDTSRVTDASYMFYQCSSLEKIPLLDLSSATNTSYTFSGCSKLKNIQNFDISNCTSANNMFSGCGLLETAPEINAPLLKVWNSMFSSCSNLKNVPVYNMSSATSLGSMFSGCVSLTDESLYNIIESLLTATSYTGTKTLSTVFSNGTYNTLKSRIQALSNYQDLVNAGWS